MGTTGPWRTPFGSAQRAHSNHPPPGSDKTIIKGLLRVAAPIREVLDHAHVDPSPPPQGFAPLGLALDSFIGSHVFHGVSLRAIIDQSNQKEKIQRRQE